jgi:hypothetical protein
VKVELVAGPPQTVPRLSRVQAENLLGIGRHPLANLQATGALDELRADWVGALATRAWVRSDSPLVVVRSGRPAVDDDGRAVGWASSYTDFQVQESARKFWVSNSDAVCDAGHILVAVSTWVVALLRVTGVEDEREHRTEKGTVLRRIAYEASVVARVDDLVAGAARVCGPVPAELEPLLAAVGQRVASPPGAPLIVASPGSTKPVSVG